MNENLNLVELLKDCPKGTKLYSTLYGEVYLKGVDLGDYPISFTRSDGCSGHVTSKGVYRMEFNGECTLFPSKDQRDWSKWQRPFVDGDIIFCYDAIAIFKEWGDETLFRTYVIKYLCSDSLIDINTPLFGKGIRKKIRFATEKEKEQLFQIIKNHGYKWNNITKTLEKLIEPKFKVGNIIQDKDGYKVKITEVNVEDECYEYESIIVKGIGGIAFSEQNDWKLVSNKFDPNTLVPFESKVLVRDANHFSWRGSIYTHREENKFYTVNGTYYHQCIPYNNDTAYLIGTCKIAPDYYRYWKNDYER